MIAVFPERSERRLQPTASCESADSAPQDRNASFSWQQHDRDAGGTCRMNAAFRLFKEPGVPKGNSMIRLCEA
jgi:hypothetical protein